MKARIFPLLFLCLSMLGCQKESRLVEEVKDLYGRTISFVDGYTYYCRDSKVSVDSCLQSGLKMVSYWEDIPCTPCACKLLNRWECEFQEKFGKDVQYLLIVNTKEGKTLISELKKMNFSLPVLLYSDKSFGEENKLNVLARNRTFLLDNNNKIIAVGEPFGNEALWKVYISAAKQQKEK